MKNKGIIIKVLAILSFIGIAYSLFASIFLQINLVKDLTPLPNNFMAIGNMISIALLIIGIYHIVLLIQALKRLDGSKLNSIFIVLIILSGITLLSDMTILSDIGKEYVFSDVSKEWYMLYAFLAFHMAVMIAGTARINKLEYSKIQLFTRISNMSDVFYLSIHTITLTCGIMGLIGVILSVVSGLVPDRYIVGLVLATAALAITPIIFNIIFWVIKFKNKGNNMVLDEKQLHDSAVSSLISLPASILVYITILALELSKTISLSSVIWVFIILFFQITVYSMVAVFKNS